MFRSKIRSIIIPQYEHGRLAGTFASMWGNKDFKRPSIDYASFVQGVTFHDWHYGIIDNLAIGEADVDDWLEIVRKGVSHYFDDPIVDIVAKLHLRRLLSGRDTAVTVELIDKIEQRITKRILQTNYTRDEFEWADRITEFSDQLAFDFSFEKPVRTILAVYEDEDSKRETRITYETKPKGKILVTPWPFSVDEFQGIIIGYRAKDYPETLVPEIIPFRCEKSA